MDNKIRDFFEQQPYTTYVRVIGGGVRVMSDWFPISTPDKIPVLEQMRYEIHRDKKRVRKIKIIRNAEIHNNSDPK